MLRLPPRSSLTDTLLPYSTLFRALLHSVSPAYLRISAARCSGLRLDCQVEESLPSHGQPQGSGLSCKCPHLRPEGEESRPYAQLGARSPADRKSTRLNSSH